MTTQKNGLGVASLVLGIISIVFCWTGLVSLVSGIVGLICAVKQKKVYQNGVATGGFVTSIIGTVFSAIYSMIWFIFTLAVGSAL